MNEKHRVGLLLVNLGSPEAPTPEALKPYLNEFLMDPEVIDIPAILRWPLVHWLIVPKRAAASAALYKKIWMKNGSPLLHFSRLFTEGLRQELGDRPEVRIELGMRYGNPSIKSAMDRLNIKELGRLIVFPLYPQYAQSSTLTAQNKVREALAAMGSSGLPPEWIPPFYAEKGYIQAACAASEDTWQSFKPDFSLFSFHGVPERHVKRVHAVCLTKDNCSDRITADNQNCYRAQCYSTARSIVAGLKIPEGKYSISFQSRLGRTPWIQPFTDHVIQDLPNKGVKRLAVFCPSFVSDCLETLDEIENREKERFLAAGGKEVKLIPSLNDHPVWIHSAGNMIRSVLDRGTGHR